MARWQRGLILASVVLAGGLPLAAAWVEPAETAEPVSTEPSDGPDGKTPLYKGWENPVLTLVITGQQRGYIEPCGCTGLANQKGGMARRHTLIRELRNKGWQVAPLDVGNQIRRVGKQAELKFQFTQSAIAEMDYQAVTFGPADLKLSAGDLAATTSDVGDVTSPYCCANVSVYGLTAKHRVIEKAGLRIGVTGVLGTAEAKKLEKTQLDAMSPEKGLAEVVPQLKAERCNLNVLLAHTSLDEAKRLAKQFPVFHLVIVSGAASEPMYQPETIEGISSQFIQTGDKGMYAGVIGLFNNPKQPIKYQRVPLDDRFADSRAMLDMMAAYQKRLMREGLSGLGVKAIPHPSGQRFVGSAKCGECHDAEYEIWEQTPHAHGTDSIVNPPERRGLARHFDPECLSCHVTGWRPQQFQPYVSGYEDLESSKHLHGVGCEDCHGPGSRHVAVESGELEASKQMRDQLRRSMQLPLAKAQDHCVECHDSDNSPDFKFDDYWPQIEH